MAEVILKEVTKDFGKSTVINDVSIKINEGDFCVIVGPSGCGKSTLLRIIAGLEIPTYGSIIINSKDVTTVDPANRGIGMVFQNYALYPHMTVEENMSFGLRMNNAPKNKINKRVGEAAKILQLTELMKRKPASLSGGQRQRVAIGRAIVKGSKVFLFDEPLSNLDAELRVEMRIELTRLHKELGATIIYVTHDQTEAMTMADKIVVLRDGCVEQVGKPLELYANPDNKFVAGFLGSPSMNFLEAKFDGKDLKIPYLENLKIKKFPKLSKENLKVTIGVRPQDVLFKRSTKGKKIEFVENLGNLSIYHLRLDKNNSLLSESPSLAASEEVGEVFDLFAPTAPLASTPRTVTTASGPDAQSSPQAVSVQAAPLVATRGLHTVPETREMGTQQLGQLAGNVLSRAYQRAADITAYRTRAPTAPQSTVGTHARIVPETTESDAQAQIVLQRPQERSKVGLPRETWDHKNVRRA